MNEINEILELIDELETQLSYKRRLVLAVNEVEKDYQKKRYTYSEYEEKLKQLLKGKKLKDWVDYYNSYVLSLLERIKFLNTQIFYKIYHDDRIERKLQGLEVISAEKKIAKPVESVKPVPKQVAKKIKKPEIPIEKPVEKPISKPIEVQEIKPERKPIPKTIPELPEIKTKKPLERPEPIKPKRKIFPIFRRKTVHEKEEIEHLKKKIAKPVIPKIEPEKIRRKAKLLEKKVPEKEYFKAYTPSAFGTMANRYFRNLGEFMVSKYPESFEKLFKAMRYANMRILSKTYVNIILLITTLAFISSFLIFMLISFLNLNIYTLLIRPLIISVLVSLGAFTITYVYPFIKADQRSKIIDANLPFAINHMSAVATSGLPPDMMFRIASQSREYKELNLELKRLVEYVDLFGYDLTTAIESLSATTPSRDFKEFLDGALATLTSGGDFSLFLREKSDQAMFSYKLRMEKYNETVSTYSDVYMGIMIVAPVFFIAILSLVSILGGTILGLDIQTVIVLGTYAIIPMLNIAFLIFLEVSQPVE